MVAVEILLEGVETITDIIRTHDNPDPSASSESARSASPDGRYFHLFSGPHAQSDIDERDLEVLAEDCVGLGASDLHASLPAGYTYLGQFVAHDVTFDVITASNAQGADVPRVNLRTPRLDLDSLYGLGPRGQRYLYDEDKPQTFRLGSDGHDLPRIDGQRAVLADPRNAENLIIAQLHVAFCRFHNKVFETITEPQSGGDSNQAFVEARKIVLWHYQWLVLNDFLPKICAPDVYQLYTEGAATPLAVQDRGIPFEFSLAAFRLHTLVRHNYDINMHKHSVPLPDLLEAHGSWGAGSVSVTSGWVVDWDKFFDLDDGHPAQRAAALDRVTTPILADSGSGRQQIQVPLATLKRGRQAHLATGQSIAAALDCEPVPEQVLAIGQRDGAQLATAFDVAAQTPLWYYLMREAEHAGQSQHLGPVGSHIVLATLFDLVKSDPSSFMGQEEAWFPHELSAHRGFGYSTPRSFEMRDLFRFLES